MEDNEYRIVEEDEEYRIVDDDEPVRRKLPKAYTIILNSSVLDREKYDKIVKEYLQRHR